MFPVAHAVPAGRNMRNIAYLKARQNSQVHPFSTDITSLTGCRAVPTSVIAGLTRNLLTGCRAIPTSVIAGLTRNLLTALILAKPLFQRAPLIVIMLPHITTPYSLIFKGIRVDAQDHIVLLRGLKKIRVHYKKIKNQKSKIIKKINI